MQLWFSCLKCIFSPCSFLVTTRYCKHPDQLINHLAYRIIIYRWMVIWWLCLCLPVCRVAVCLCDLSFCMRPDIEDGIFIWRLICLLRLILSCILCGCEMYISVHQIMMAMGVSQRFKICVSAKRKRVRQWGEMTSVIKFVCGSFVYCSSAGQWITVCVCRSASHVKKAPTYIWVGQGK